MLRAVSQMVTSSAAATAMMTVATSIQRRHEAQRSALVMGVLTRGALIDVVLPGAWSVHAPEAIFLARRAPWFLRSKVLPLAVEEFDRLVGDRLSLHVGPSARHLAGDVPTMLAVCLAIRQSPKATDDPADRSSRERRDRRAGRRLVERTELVREAGHRAADADAAGAHAPAHVVDGAPHDDVAIDDGTPASDLNETLGIAVVLGEHAFLVESRPGAAMVDRVAKQPRRAAELVERRQRTEALEEQQDGEHSLGEVIALRRAARDVDDRQAERAAVVLREKVHDAHRARGITFGRGNTTPRRARADRNGRRRAGRQSL